VAGPLHTGRTRGMLSHPGRLPGARPFPHGNQLMMGLILQSRALEGAFAVAAAAMCGVVLWKSIDYIVTTKRNSRERNGRTGPDNQP